MFLRPLQLEASTALLRDPANLRDGNIPMLSILTHRMLERSDNARDLHEERGIFLARVSLR